MKLQENNTMLNDEYRDCVIKLASYFNVKILHERFKKGDHAYFIFDKDNIRVVVIDNITLVNDEYRYDIKNPSFIDDLYGAFNITECELFRYRCEALDSLNEIPKEDDAHVKAMMKLGSVIDSYLEFKNKHGLK